MPDQPQDSGQPVPAPTGGEVERFHPGCDNDGVFLEMSRWPNGDWVRYEDYEKLKREWDLLCEELEHQAYERDLSE